MTTGNRDGSEYASGRGSVGQAGTGLLKESEEQAGQSRQRERDELDPRAGRPFSPSEESARPGNPVGAGQMSSSERGAYRRGDTGPRTGNPLIDALASVMRPPKAEPRDTRAMLMEYRARMIRHISNDQAKLEIVSRTIELINDNAPSQKVIAMLDMLANFEDLHDND